MDEAAKKPLVKGFWETRRHVFEAVGIISAVGALFLAIPEPENVEAVGALRYAKLAWLLIILIGLITLVVQAVIFGIIAEREARKEKIEFEGALDQLMFWPGIFLIYATARYTWFEYSALIENLLQNTGVSIIMALLFARLQFGISSKIRSGNLSVLLEIFLHLATNAIFAFIQATLAIAGDPGANPWLKFSHFFIAMMATYSAIDCIFRLRTTFFIKLLALLLLVVVLIVMMLIA